MLVSAKDGSVIRNLTKGFDQKYGFEFIVTPGGRWNTVPWLSWRPAATSWPTSSAPRSRAR